MTKLEKPSASLLSRREVMAAGAGLAMASVFRMGEAVAGAGQRGAAAASTRQAPMPVPSCSTELRLLAPNVYAYERAGGQGIPSSAISNGACIVGPDNYMAIDAFAAPPHAKAFLAAAKQTIGKPCGRLVNTHHHADHTTGNCFFLPAEIVGSEYCRQAVLKGGISDLRGRPESWKVGAEELKLAPPVTTVAGSKVTYYYGDTIVELISAAPAHTYGDVMVYLPQYKILFAGDVAFFYVAPAGQSAHMSKWIEALDRINKMDVDIIVPGHGCIGTKKDLLPMRDYLVTVKREARTRYDAGMSPGKAAAEIEKVISKFDNWVDPAANRLIANTVRLYAEFKGILTPDNDGGDAVAALGRQANQDYAANGGRYVGRGGGPGDDD